MKARSFYSALAGVVGLLLLLAVVGFVGLVSQSPLRLLKAGQDLTPAGAIFVSRQAPAMVSLLVKPEELATFRLALAKSGRRQARAELAQLEQNLLASTGLSYESDIQPWIGKELTLAITTLDIDRDATNGKQPGYLLAIATQDTERAREFLQLFWQKRAISGTDLEFEQYKGVKLISANAVKATTGKRQPNANPKPQVGALITPTLTSAVVGDRFVLFANHPKVLRDAINNVQAADLNLSNSSGYQTALETLTQPRIGLAFVNLPKLASWLAEISDQTVKVPTAVDAAASTYETMAIALELDRRGVVAETALLGKRDHDVVPNLSQPVEALQYVPGDSPFVAAGTDLDRLWQGVSGDLSSYGADRLLNQALQDLQTRWHLDLPRDIFKWVKGEYALAMLPSDQPSGASQKPTTQKQKDQKSGTPAIERSGQEWVFVAQRSPGPRQPDIEKLDQLAKQQGLSAGPIKLDNQTAFAWTRLTTSGNGSAPLSLQAEVKGVRAAVGHYEIFTPSIAAMDRVLKVADRSIAKQDHFKQAIAPLIQPNNGYLYLDWNASKSMLERQLPLLKVAELLGSGLFSHLQSLTISNYGSQAGVQRGGIFMRLS